MTRLHAARCLALLSLLTLALPALSNLAPTAEAAHSGIQNADAFSGRLVFLGGTGLAQSLGSDGNWRDGSGTTYTRIGAANNQANTCGAAQSTASPAQQDIWFVKDNATSNPTVNRTNQENRTIDNLFVRGHRISSGSNQHCGYFYGIAPDQSTLVFIGVCGSIGGGNSANGEAYNECNFAISNQPFSGIRIFVATQYCCSNTPWVEIAELQGNGVEPTPPTQQATLTVTPQGCTNNAAWTTTSDTTQYKLYRADGPGFNYTTLTPIATVAHPGGGYTDFGLGSGKSYYYQVVPTNVDGDGPPSAIVDGTAGVCDGTGLGVIGADGHMGPNVLTHHQSTNRYTNLGQWSVTSNGGGHTLGCTDVGEVGNMYLPCATDGVTSTYINLYSVSTYTRSSSSCRNIDGYVEWTFPAQSVKTFHAKVRPYNEGTTAGTNTTALCVQAAYQSAATGTWLTANTWTGLANQTDAQLWYNNSLAVNATGVRWYIGDMGSGIGKGGMLLYETDVYDVNATYYHMQTSLRDLAAGTARPSRARGATARSTRRTPRCRTASGRYSCPSRTTRRRAASTTGNSTRWAAASAPRPTASAPASSRGRTRTAAKPAPWACTRSRSAAARAT